MKYHNSIMNDPLSRISSSVLIPTVIEQEGRYERAYDIYSRLLKERIIFLGSDISEDSANIIVAQMLFLQANDPKKDIYLYINSPGGSAYDALAIYDTIQYVSNDVQTVGIGVQASAAAFILSSGTKGKRFLLPNSTVMIHQPSSVTVTGFFAKPSFLYFPKTTSPTMSTSATNVSSL